MNQTDDDNDNGDDDDDDDDNDNELRNILQCALIKQSLYSPFKENEYDMKNYVELVGCCPPQPSASVDNTPLDLHNSSYHKECRCECRDDTDVFLYIFITFHITIFDKNWK